MHQVRNRGAGRDPLRSQSSKLYIYVLKKRRKSSNANSTHLNKKAPHWDSPPPPPAAPSGTRDRAGQEDGWDRPHFTWHSRGSVVGLAQESGPRSDSAPWSQVRNSPATGREATHDGHSGTPNSSKYQRGEEKNQQRARRILQSPMYSAPGPGQSSLWWGQVA